MLTLQANENNDLVLNSNGNLALVTGQNAILQNTVTAMKAQRGEMPFNMLGGMPTLMTAWEDLDIDSFEAAARRIILSIDGVISISNFEVSQQSDVLQYTADLQTIQGPLTIGGSNG